MAVTIRMSRHGTRKRPFYRIVVTDSRSPRDGRFIEVVGTSDPKKSADACTWNVERLQYWLSHGARPSETVSQLLPAGLQ